MGQRGWINLRDNLIRGRWINCVLKRFGVLQKVHFLQKKNILSVTISVLNLTIEMISSEKKRSPELKKVVTCADGRDVKIRLED